MVAGVGSRQQPSVSSSLVRGKRPAEQQEQGREMAAEAPWVRGRWPGWAKQPKRVTWLSWTGRFCCSRSVNQSRRWHMGPGQAHLFLDAPLVVGSALRFFVSGAGVERGLDVLALAEPLLAMTPLMARSIGWLLAAGVATAADAALAVLVVSDFLDFFELLPLACGVPEVIPRPTAADDESAVLRALAAAA